MAKGKKKNPFYDSGLFKNIAHSKDLKTDEDIDRGEIAVLDGSGERTTISLVTLKALLRLVYETSVHHERILMEVVDRENEKPYNKRVVPYREREPVTMTVSWADWIDYDTAWSSFGLWGSYEGQRNPLFQKMFDCVMEPERYVTFQEMLEEQRIRMEEEHKKILETETPEEKAERQRVYLLFTGEESPD